VDVGVAASVPPLREVPSRGRRGRRAEDLGDVLAMGGGGAGSPPAVASGDCSRGGLGAGPEAELAAASGPGAPVEPGGCSGGCDGDEEEESIPAATSRAVTCRRRIEWAIFASGDAPAGRDDTAVVTGVVVVGDNSGAAVSRPAVRSGPFAAVTAAAVVAAGSAVAGPATVDCSLGAAAPPLTSPVAAAVAMLPGC
jgi:hypothetical protein